MKLTFSTPFILLGILSFGLTFSAASQAQVTMEGGFGFNTFETAYGAADIGAVDSMVSNIRDDKLNRTAVYNSTFGANATAIGNLVNVVTVGSGNTTVVNAKQQNSGNQTATVSLSSKKIDASASAQEQQQPNPSTNAAAISSTSK
jgi:hypothetical protein